MRLRIVIGPDNTVLVSALDGSFEQASAEIRALLDALGTSGVALTPETPIEQHRHAPTEARVHEHDAAS
jgi:hypothetical protein